ncbi:MAG: RidA family protein [Burkholderiales bacterium]
MPPTNDHDDTDREARYLATAAQMSLPADGEIRVGGHYAGLVEHAGIAYISGQIPRVGDAVAVVGHVGAERTLDDAQRAARICVMRALALLRQQPGGLARVERVLAMTVYTQSAPGFVRQSEVADAASDLLHDVLGTAGVHTRTSVGVSALPKNAAVELNLVVALRPAPGHATDRTT